MRREAWRWTSARRMYIPKKKGKRPLGLPHGQISWFRKLCVFCWKPTMNRDSVHCLLAFSPVVAAISRYGRLCISGGGVKWFIEGDIKGCFDNIDYDILLSILRESIHDNRFTRLVSSMLRTGYFDDWKYNKTLSGTPHGGLCSTLLSNICLDKLERFAEEVLLPEFNQGKRRRNYPPYKAPLNASSGNYLMRGSSSPMHVTQEGPEVCLFTVLSG